MNKNLILQLGVLLLLVQLAVVTCSSSKVETFYPEDKTSFSEEETSSSEELQINPLAILLFSTIEDFSKMTITNVEANKKLFEAVIREGSASKNRQLQTHLSKLSEFVEKANQLKETPNRLDKLVDLVSDITTLYAQFDSDQLKNPSQDILLMNELLKKLGSEEIKLQAIKGFWSFIDSFNKKLDEEVSLLTAEWNSAEFQDWYQRYTTENDMEKKFDLFTEFIDFISDPTNVIND